MLSGNHAERSRSITGIPVRNFILSETNLRKILDSTNKFESNNMFYSLIKYMNNSSHILNCQKEGLAHYISSNDFGSNIRVYTSAMMSNADVLGDIRSAKIKIMLMIPKGRICKYRPMRANCTAK